MHSIATQMITHNLDELDVDFSYTAIDQPIVFNQYDVNYVIDIDGTTYMIEPHNKKADLLIVGGIKQFAHEKAPRVRGKIFITDNQRRTLTKLMKTLSYMNQYCEVYSENYELNQVLNAMFVNYGG